MNQHLNIAIVQENRDPYDCKANTQKGLDIVRKAKKQGADLVLFPECWITGYEFPTVENSLPLEELVQLPAYKEWAESALTEDSAYLKAFRDLAAELQIGIVITGYMKGREKPCNSAVLIDRTGEVIMQYNKVHTCDFADERMLESGDAFKVCVFDGVKIGIMICYDREYPESARMLMLKGAEIILVPNDCGAMPARVQALSTRAYENMTGVVMANCPGENAGWSCAFSPIVWDRQGNPVDNTLVLADDLSKKIYLATYDIGELRAYRNREMMGNTFRKVKAYADLLSETIQAPFIRE